MDLSVTSREQDDRTIVTVSGEVDLYTAPTLRERLNTLVSSGHHHLVLDLEGVAFLDSTGLGVLVGGLKRIRSRGGSLHMVCRHEKILKVFQITGLTRVFLIYDTVAEAVAAPVSVDGTDASS